MKLEHLAPYLPYKLKAYNKCMGLNLYREIEASNIMSFIDKSTEAKPILRPLSDLTKEIEHNGEKFVPHIKLGGRPNLTDYDIDYLSKKINEMCYGLIAQLIEWHFDVFGLIEKGEAIDINTL